MDIKLCEKKEKSEFEIIIAISPEEFESAIVKAFIKNRKSVFVPGFRKGKAPRKIIEGMYGASVFHPDALDIIVPEALDFAVENSGLKTVGYPEVTDIDIKEDKSGVDVTLKAAVYPEVSIGEYKGLKAVKLSPEVPDRDIDLEIDAIRTRNARIEKAERPAAIGDTTIIDFEGIVDGEKFEGGQATGYELELGSNAFIPGFEDGIVGMEIGQQRSIELVFPDDYTPQLSGKPVVFNVKLCEISEKILPELDDEFVKDVSEFDTLDEYKADIRSRLEAAKQADVETAFENSLMEQLADIIEAEVPDALVEEQMDISMNKFAHQVQSYGMEPAQYLQMMNVSEEVFRESMREKSEKEVRITLALEKIAELEEIEVTDEDVDNELKEAAEKFGMELEKLTESVSKEKVRQDIKTRRAAKLVIDSAISEPPPANTGDESEKAESSSEKKTATKAKKPAAKTSDETGEEKPKPAAKAKKTSADSSEKPAASTKKASVDSPEKPAAKAKKANEDKSDKPAAKPKKAAADKSEKPAATKKAKEDDKE